MAVRGLNHSRQANTPKGCGPTIEELSQFAKQAGSRASARYLRLVMEFPIRPIRSDKELDQAICVLDRLLGRKRALDSQEQGYFDSLSHEIRLHEEASIIMPAVSGAEMLRHLIDAREATMTDVAEQTGIAVSTISAVLGGKRKLNRNHIENLARFFGVAPGVFLN